MKESLKLLLALLGVIGMLSFSVEAQTGGGNPYPENYYFYFGKAGGKLGKVSLGMTKKQVTQQMPLMGKSYSHSHGVEELTFIYRTPKQERAIYTVLFMGGRVVQLATTDQRYTVEGGTPIFVNLQRIREAFSSMNLNLKRTDYYFPLDKGKKRIEFYDEVQQGVAFAVIPAVDTNEIVNEFLADFGFRRASSSNSPIPNYLIVHNPGRPVIGILNGTRGDTIAPRAAPAPKPVKVSLTSVQRHKAQNALRALRSVESVGSVGTYFSFANQLADSKIVIDDALRSLPSSPLKTEIERAVFAYSTARSAWADSITDDSSFSATRAVTAMESASARIKKVATILSRS